MRLRIDDAELGRIHEDARYRCRRFGSDVQKAIRRLIALIEEVPDQRDLYRFKSLRLEKLRGERSGQYSMRVNDQFRMIVHFATQADGQICIVIEVVDYH